MWISKDPMWIFTIEINLGYVALGLGGDPAELRFPPADLVHQKIWAWLTVHHAIAVLIAAPPKPPTSTPIASVALPRKMIPVHARQQMSETSHVCPESQQQMRSATMTAC
jgi:hypothetical protein